MQLALGDTIRKIVIDNWFNSLANDVETLRIRFYIRASTVRRLKSFSQCLRFTLYFKTATVHCLVLVYYNYLCFCGFSI